jgi:hypothetical protein
VHEVTVISSGVMAVAITTPVIESGLVALAVVLLIALLVVRSKRARDQKLRKAASTGYYDPDVARYGYGSPAVPAEPPIDFDGIPLAPTFLAPGRGKATKRSVSEPRPAPAFGTMILAPPRPVPAFDQASVIGGRPVSDGASPVSDGAPPPPPPPPSPAPAPPPASSLPPLVQPPPPVGAPADSGSASIPDAGTGR